MTQVILNLGLDRPTYRKPVGSYNRDTMTRNYLAKVNDILEHGVGWDLQGDTLIGWGRLRKGYGSAHLAAIAEEAGQDCIAAWYPDLKVGKLYGTHPWASAWGAFNLMHFLFPKGYYDAPV